MEVLEKGTIGGIANEKMITILKVIKAEHWRETEKDSPEGFWKCEIKYLGKAITTKASSGTIFIKSISEKYIKTGQYVIDLKSFFENIPLFKAV